MSKNNFEIFNRSLFRNLNRRKNKKEGASHQRLPQRVWATNPEQGAETNPCDGTPCQEIQLFSLWCLEDTEGSRNISWAFKSCGISK